MRKQCVPREQGYLTCPDSSKQVDIVVILFNSHIFFNAFAGYCDSKDGKVTEGVSGPRGVSGYVCFSAKERQLVQVAVSPYTCPTFVLSVAVSC